MKKGQNRSHDPHENLRSRGETKAQPLVLVHSTKGYEPEILAAVRMNLVSPTQDLPTPQDLRPCRFTPASGATNTRRLLVGRDMTPTCKNPDENSQEETPLPPRPHLEALPQAGAAERFRYPEEPGRENSRGDE